MDKKPYQTLFSTKKKQQFECPWGHRASFMLFSNDIHKAVIDLIIDHKKPGLVATSPNNKTWYFA